MASASCPWESPRPARRSRTTFPVTTSSIIDIRCCKVRLTAFSVARPGPRCQAGFTPPGRVPRPWYIRLVRDRYAFTGDGLHNIAVYGIEPVEVWQVLHAVRRLTRQMADDVNAVFGPTAKGRYLVVFVVESAGGD